MNKTHLERADWLHCTMQTFNRPN